MTGISKQFLICLFLFMATPILALDAGWQELPSANIYFSENPIDLDLPILKYKNDIYVPIRSILPYLNGRIEYQKRTHSFMVLVENLTSPIVLIPNHRGYTIGETRHEFPHPTLMHWSRLYVPLQPFLSIINYQSTVKDNSIYIFSATAPSVESTPEASPKSAPQTPIDTKDGKLLAKIKRGSGLNISTSIPNLRTINHPQLSINSQTVDITHQFSYQYGTLHLNIIPILESLGYESHISGGTLTLNKGGIKYKFTSNSPTLNVSSNSGSTNKTLNYEPKIENQKAYFPIGTFAEDLGYTTYWDSKTGTIELWPIVDGIELWKYPNGLYKLRIIAKQPLNALGQYMLSNPLLLFWDLPNTAMQLTHDKLQINDNQFTHLYVGQHPDKLRISLRIDHRVKSIMYPNSDGMDIYITKTTNTAIPKASETSTKAIAPPTPKPTQQPKSTVAKHVLKGKIITIDPGHGGRDPGAVTKSGDLEKYYTIDISKRLQDLLEGKGAKVLMARTGDQNPSLYQRTMLANTNRADILISVHINSFIKSYANGIETYYYKRQDKALAQHIHNKMVSKLGLRDAGLKRSQMYVLNHSTMPGALIEPCFITNSKEYRQLRQPEFRQKIAQATYEGIISYFQSKN
ncbi:MAG: N-acetylmuramoyl-L-alanine amidase [bacterium]|nr:N-acetylmuramoyl-L-alanine amidase [bacterium]